MELKRLEGVLLQYAIEQGQTKRAERAGEEIRVRVLSTVPDVLLELSTSGSPIKARVSYSSGGMVDLMLSNGFELRAENKSSIPLKTGDMVELTFTEGNPLTFRVTGLFRKNSTEDILRTVLEGKESFAYSVNSMELEEEVKNSGVFYERKLLDFLLGKIKAEELLKDQKAQLTASLLPLVETLSELMGVEVEKNLESIKNLFSSLRLEVGNFEKLMELLKRLNLEHLSHKEYLDLIRHFEMLGQKNLILALEKGDRPIFLRELYKLLMGSNAQNLEFLKEAFETLDEIDNLTVKQFSAALKDGSERVLREAYRALKEYMEAGERLAEFYQTRGAQMESLIQRLDFINQLQWSMLKQGDGFYLPLYHRGGRGGIVFKAGKEYTVVFKLDYEEGFVSGFLRMPKGTKKLDIKLYTDILSLADKLKGSRETLQSILSDEGIDLRNFLVEVKKDSDLAEEISSHLATEGFLLLA